MGNLLAQATALDLFVHQMAGFDHEAAAQVADVPAGYSVVVAAALGYLGEAADLPDGVDEKNPDERERNALADIVFEGAWGKALG